MSEAVCDNCGMRYDPRDPAATVVTVGVQSMFTKAHTFRYCPGCSVAAGGSHVSTPPPCPQAPERIVRFDPPGR